MMILDQRMAILDFKSGRSQHAARRSKPPPLRLLVKQVALHLGFADQYQFSRAFKRVFGMSPTRFQRDTAGERPFDLWGKWANHRLPASVEMESRRPSGGWNPSKIRLDRGGVRSADRTGDSAGLERRLRSQLLRHGGS
jgi:hypothetical protein